MYAKAGTEAHANLMKRVKLRAQPDPDPTHPEPVENHDAPPSATKPAARAARSAFDILMPTGLCARRRGHGRPTLKARCRASSSR
jgi:hypothetical protein